MCSASYPRIPRRSAAELAARGDGYEGSGHGLSCRDHRLWQHRSGARAGVSGHRGDRARRGSRSRGACAGSFPGAVRCPRTYAQAGEMLRNEQLDFVSICLWHLLHAEFTLLAAAHRPTAILCEKPIATCLAEADAMIAACETSSIKLAVGHQRRFNRSWTRARDLLAEGAIGTPLLITVQTGEGLLNCGTHVVDAVRTCWAIRRPIGCSAPWSARRIASSGTCAARTAAWA